MCFFFICTTTIFTLMSVNPIWKMSIFQNICLQLGVMSSRREGRTPSTTVASEGDVCRRKDHDFCQLRVRLLNSSTYTCIKLCNTCGVAVSIKTFVVGRAFVLSVTCPCHGRCGTLLTFSSTERDKGRRYTTFESAFFQNIFKTRNTRYCLRDSTI